MDITVLGAGYVGSQFIEKYPCRYSSRKAVEDERSFVFDLEDRTTWVNIPKSDSVLITFAIKDLALIEEFYEACLKSVKKVYVYASTSSYKVKFNGETVSEENELNLDLARVSCEEFLCNKGANLLTLSGIFGPNRMPEAWLKKGLIKNGNKNLNLIHLDDIVELTHRLMLLDLKGERVNLSNAEEIYWHKLADTYGLDCPRLDLDRANKFISNQKVLSLVGDYTFKKLLES